MKRVVKKMIWLALALVLMSTSILAGANEKQSVASIDIDETGAWGSNITISTGAVKIIGYNDLGGSTNTLYVAVQRQGYTTSGGVVMTYAVPIDARVSLASKEISTGSYHVLLDPSGINSSGCHGKGGIAPTTPKQ